MRLRNTAIPLIERAYAGLDLPRAEWLQALREEAERTFDGVISSAQAYEFEISGEGAHGTLGVAADDPWLTAYRVMHELSPPTTIRKAYLNGPLFLAANVFARTGSDAPMQVMQSMGVSDVVCAVGLDPGGRGVGISWMRTSRGSLSRDVRRALQRIAAHVGSAARLRARGEQADAVLAPDGRLLHAENEAKQKPRREALREAARRMDKARVSRSSRSEGEATELWRALVDGRWSLVERFESDGRRVIVARRNDPTTRPNRLLSDKERKVVALAAVGRPLKVIAYELGIGEATVSTLLRQAMKKMGVRDRSALVELHGAVLGAEQEPGPATGVFPRK